MRLIITEKNNSAQKIAEILSGGAATETKSFTIPVFKWSDSEGETSVVGTGGHGVERAFPEEKEYKQWKLDLIHGLVDAPLITRPTDGKKNVIRAVQKEAKAADSLVIATDFDREGELIGLESLEVALEVTPDLEPTVKRARYAALTKEEIESVGYEYMDVNEALERYNPEVLNDGWNTLPDGEKVYFISTPSAGLWATRAKLEERDV